MIFDSKDKYLITSNSWFYGEDGKQYRAAWGKIEICGDQPLGIKTNHMSSNWFMKIGNEKRHIFIAGCQINFAIKCNKKPNSKNMIGWEMTVDKIGVHKMPCPIWFSE